MSESDKPIALGQNANALGDSGHNIAMGAGANASGQNFGTTGASNTAIGQNAAATGTVASNLAIGANATGQKCQNFFGATSQRILRHLTRPWSPAFRRSRTVRHVALF